MKPKLGDIVIYNTTEKEHAAMRESGNNEQHQLPAIVVAVWGDVCVNLKVIHDGACIDAWKTSVAKAPDLMTAQEGCWNFKD